MISQCINHMLNTLSLDRDKIIKGRAGFSWFTKELRKASVAAFRKQTAIEKSAANKCAWTILSFTDFGQFLGFWHFDLQHNVFVICSLC